MKISCLAFILLFTSSSLNALTSTTTTISSSLNPSTYGQAVTFTAVVTSQSGSPPNGEIITFEQGSTTLGTGTLSGGKATYTISTLVATQGTSTDNIKATYPGDANFKTSTSPAVGQVVHQATTTTTLSSSQNPANVGQSVTFTASVAPEYSGTTATGRVFFYNGSTKLGSNTLTNNTTIFTTASLPQGNDQITAQYVGSSDFTASTSEIVNQSIENGTTVDTTMTWDGVTRYYQVYVPAVLPANPPMLLMLHGTTYDTPPANPSTTDWGWSSIANQYQFIEVQPASTYNANTGQWNWNAYFMSAAFTSAESGTCSSPPASACPDDAGFLRQLITNLTSQYHVNSNQVFVAGFSSGAQMTERIGVELSDIVAAIAPTSGQMEGQQAAPPPVLVPGNAVAPVSVQEWHGTADTELPPCDYGTTVYSKVTFYLDTVDDTFNYWVQQNKCSTLQTTQTLCTNGQATQGLSGNIATGCSKNVVTQFIWESGVGHSWQSKNNATKWLFLAAHPK